MFYHFVLYTHLVTPQHTTDVEVRHQACYLQVMQGASVMCMHICGLVLNGRGDDVQVGMRVDLELADGSKACGVYIHKKLSDSAG